MAVASAGLCLLPVGLADVDASEVLGMSPIELGDVLPGSLAVRGHVAVYAVRAPDGVSANVKAYDAQSGQRALVSPVPSAAGEARIDSIDYDGQFVVWSDNRAGTLQIHVADPANHTFQTITRSQSDQRQVRVDEGIAVWASWGDFTIRGQNLREGGVFLVGGNTGLGPASSPDIHRGRIAWSQSDAAGHFQLRLTDLATGTAQQLTNDSLVHSSPRLTDTRIAWLESQLPGQPSSAEGARIVSLEIESKNVAFRNELGDVGGRPALSDDWLLWANGTSGLDLFQFSTGKHVSVPVGKVHDAAVSDELAAIIAETPDGLRLFAAPPQAMRAADGGDSPSPGLLVVVAASACALAAFGTTRRQT